MHFWSADIWLYYVACSDRKFRKLVKLDIFYNFLYWTDIKSIWTQMWWRFLLSSESSRISLTFWRIYFLRKQRQNLTASDLPKWFHTTVASQSPWSSGEYMTEHLKLWSLSWKTDFVGLSVILLHTAERQSTFNKKKQRAWPSVAHPLGKLPRSLLSFLD